MGISNQVVDVMLMKAVMSWSGGKESCLACYKAISEGFEVSHLLNFVSKDGRCVGHGIDPKLARAQSQALGIPIIQRMVTPDTHEREFKKAIRELKQRGIEGAVFGDIQDIPLPLHEGWIDRVCSELGITPVKPLWGKDPKQILSEFVSEGFEALIIKVKVALLGEEWLGRKIDEVFVKDLEKLQEKSDFNLCGELGEYHTFVYDGPLFRKRLRIFDFEKTLTKGCWFLDIRSYDIVEKRTNV
jgi:diphthine-ammonia ligase